jgi:hypothetical protein
MKAGRDKAGKRLDLLNDEEALEDSLPIVIARESTTKLLAAHL